MMRRVGVVHLLLVALSLLLALPSSVAQRVAQYHADFLGNRRAAGPKIVRHTPRLHTEWVERRV